MSSSPSFLPPSLWASGGTLLLMGRLNFFFLSFLHRQQENIRRCMVTHKELSFAIQFVSSFGIVALVLYSLMSEGSYAFLHLEEDFNT